MFKLKTTVSQHATIMYDRVVEKLGEPEQYIEHYADTWNTYQWQIVTPAKTIYLSIFEYGTIEIHQGASTIAITNNLDEIDLIIETFLHIKKKLTSSTI